MSLEDRVYLHPKSIFLVWIRVTYTLAVLSFEAVIKYVLSGENWISVIGIPFWWSWTLLINSPCYFINHKL